MAPGISILALQVQADKPTEAKQNYGKISFQIMQNGR
jgi:hypothetical protein